MNDQLGGFSINGKGFPATSPITAKKGQKVRIRYMNEGQMIHPMHLHGMPQLVFAKDGWNLPQPYRCDTLNVAPGERYDVIVDCTEPGAWAFHCHILSHAEGEHGMYRHGNGAGGCGVVAFSINQNLVKNCRTAQNATSAKNNLRWLHSVSRLNQISQCVYYYRGLPQDGQNFALACGSAPQLWHAAWPGTAAPDGATA